jgi:hypothetical protein
LRRHIPALRGTLRREQDTLQVGVSIYDSFE